MSPASGRPNKVVPRLVYLLRHGEIETPGGGRRYIGAQDFALSPAGREQARFWSERFARVDLEAIYCSPLSRCLDTVGTIGKRCGISPVVVPAFKEIDLGEWEGRRMETIRTLYPHDYARRGDEIADFRPPGGESFRDLQRRVLPAFGDLPRRHDAPILIVTHAGVIRVLLCHLLDMPLKRLFRIGLDYGSLTIVQIGGADCRLQSLNLSDFGPRQRHFLA